MTITLHEEGTKEIWDAKEMEWDLWVKRLFGSLAIHKGIGPFSNDWQLVTTCVCLICTSISLQCHECEKENVHCKQDPPETLATLVEECLRQDATDEHDDKV
jgi:hypothetical protein